MEKESKLLEVKKLLCNYTDVAAEEMDESSRLTSDLGLTSFDLICLGGALQDHFGVKCKDKVISSLQTVGDVVDILNC